ncbi:MAG: pentapeptide repeat-containing protein [Myxococcota bacterium]|nr:pentapeptide repeat-containing protein [Myxococcota bacterium]
MAPSPSSLLGRRIGQQKLAEMPLCGADLRGVRIQDADLSGRDLSGVDLRRATLVRVRLDSANLQSADLREAELESCSLRSADLGQARLNRLRAAGCDLRGVSLTGASLQGAFLAESELSGADLRGADASQARLEYSRLRGADLRGLQGTRISLDGAELRDADLRDARLSRAGLEGADLRGARLSGAELVGARLNRVLLDGADLQGLSLDGVRLPRGRLSEEQRRELGLHQPAPPPPDTPAPESPEPDPAASEDRLPQPELGPGAALRGADLRGRDLRGVDLREADLREALLSRADLRGAVLDGARLGGADLRRVRLEEASLRGLRGRGLRLEDARLEGADLRGARLFGAKASGVRLRGARLAGAELRDAELRDADLRGLDLAGVDLRGASLAGADLADASLAGAKLGLSELEGVFNLRPAQVQALRRGHDSPLADDELEVAAEGAQALLSWLRGGAQALSERASQLDSSLSTLKLPGPLPDRLGPRRGAVPAPERLRPGAELRGVSLRGQRLEDLNLAGADLRDADLRAVTLRRGSLAGADLRGAWLNGAELHQVDLTSARLRGAHLEDALLKGCRLEGASLERAQAQGLSIEGGALGGLSLREADLRGARLEGLDLSGVDLREAQLQAAALGGTTLLGGRLQGAELGSARGLDRAQRVALRGAGASVGGALADALALGVEDWKAERAARAERATRQAQARAEREAKAAQARAEREAQEAQARAEREARERAERAAAEQERVRREQAERERAREEAALQALEAQARQEAADRARQAELEAEAEALREKIARARQAAEQEWAREQAEQRAREAEAAAREAKAAEAAREAEAAAREAEIAARAVEASEPDPEPEREETWRQALGALGGLVQALKARRQGPALPELVPGVDLSGLDLRRARLEGLDLSGADLRGARLEGMRLRGLKLRGAQLQGARLRGARLEEVDLQESKLQGAELEDARFYGCDLRRASLMETRALGVRVEDCLMVGASFRGAELIAARLMDLSFEGVDLREARLDQADLSGSSLLGAQLRGAELSGALGLSSATRAALSEQGVDLGLARLPELPRIPLPKLAGGVALLAGLGVVGFLATQLADRSAETLESEATQALQSGDQRTALERWEQLAAQASTPAEAWMYRMEQASLLERQGEQAAAVERFEQALALAESPEEQAETQARLARIEASQGQLDQAITRWTDITELLGAPPSAVAAALLELERHGVPARQRFLEQSAGNSGRQVDVSVAAAKALGARGETQAALDWLAHLYDLDPAQQRAVLVATGEVNAASGDLQAALQAWSAALEGRPWRLEDGALRLQLAQAHLQLGDLDAAQQQLDALLTQGAHAGVTARALLLRAELAELQRQDPTPYLLQVLAEHADNREALRAAELSLAATLDPAEQEALVAARLDAGDRDAASWLLLSMAREQPDTAEARIQRVLSLEPGPDVQLAAQLQLADLRLYKDQTEGAIRALRAARAQAGAEQLPELDARIGEALLAGGRLQEAERAFTTLQAEVSPGSEIDLRAQLGLAQVLEAQGALEQARGGYQAVIARSQDPALRSQALDALAGNLLESGDPQAALEAWRAHLRSLPPGHSGAFDARFAVANLLRQQGQEAAAAAELAKAQPQTPTQRAWQQIGLAEIDEVLGAPASAMARYQSLLADPELPPSEVEVVQEGLARVDRVLRGVPEPVVQEDPSLDQDPLSQGLAAATALADEWDFPGALQALEDIPVPDRATAALVAEQRGWILVRSGDLQAARAAFTQLGAEFADQPEARFQSVMGLAQVDRIEGDPDAALVRYQALSPQDPGLEVQRLTQLAATHLERGDSAQARATYKALLIEHPAHTEAQSTARMGLAELARDAGELEAARGLYEQVARTAEDPSLASWSTLQAAMILVDQGDLDASEDRLLALRQDPDPELRLQAALGLSAIELERGSARKAMAYVDEARALELGEAWAATVLQQQVQVHLNSGDIAAAQDAWRSALDAGAQGDLQAQAWLGLGDLALGQEDPAAALDAYESLLAVGPERGWEARALLGKARALQALGDHAAAQALLDTLLSDYGDQPEVQDAARALE